MAWWRSKSSLPTALQKIDLPVEFGRYELVEKLGQGGMGQVFRAVLRGPAGFRKDVALKLVAGQDASEQAREDFLNEARLGALLDHPNLVSTHDLGEVDGHLFITMDLVKGITLDALMRRKRTLPGAAVLDVGVQLCVGLASAHSLRKNGQKLGLIHCDLKPSNVLISHRGRVRLTDFGLAQAMTVDGDLTVTGLRGSLNYMSPEQLTGQSLDVRTDIYSLGLVLAELTLGRRLIDESEREAIIAIIRDIDTRMAEPELRTMLDASVPGLTAVLEQCICGDRAGRFPDMVSLGRALTELIPRVQDARSLVEVLESEGIGDSESLDYSLRDSVSQSLKSLRSPIPDHLGPDSDSFIGRQRELDQLDVLIREGRSLITIKGPGGSGKTRLARQLGRRLQKALEGHVWCCDLSTCTDLSSLLQSVGRTLTTPLGRGDPEELVMLLGHVLHSKGPSLLILDNFEQLVELGPRTLSWWRRMAPETILVVTSRSRIGVSEEHVFELPTLPRQDAVALLLERAKIKPDRERSREALEQLAVQLDGLPLAIELAAARLGMLTPEGLLGRLNQRFKLLSRHGGTDRHSTLRATIDCSWDFLEPWEQSALAQLSVFRGGVFLEAAEAIVDLDRWPEAPWVMDVISALLDHSLITSRSCLEQPRFSMYESIREYAAEKLHHLDTADPRRAHARYYARLGSPQSVDALSVHGGLERRRAQTLEIENLIAGYENAVRLGDHPVAIRCAVTAVRILHKFGPVHRGLDLIEEALGCTEPDAREQIELMREKAWSISILGDIDTAVATNHRALEQVRELGDIELEAVIQSDLAHLTGLINQVSVSDSHYLQALRLSQAVGNRPREALVCVNQAMLWMNQGRLKESQMLLESALKLAAEVGNVFAEAPARSTLGLILSSQGRTDEAREQLELSISLLRRMGSRRQEGSALQGLATLQHNVGDLSASLQTHRKALRIHRSLGNRRQECIVLGNMGDLHMSRGEPAQAEPLFEAAIELGDEVLPAAAGAFRGSLASLVVNRGELETAHELLDRGEAALRGVNPSELGKLLCRRGRIALLASSPELAKAALEEVEEIASELGLGSQSVLGRSIEELREEVGSTTTC